MGLKSGMGLWKGVWYMSSGWHPPSNEGIQPLLLLSLLKAWLFRASRSRSQLTHSVRNPEEYRALMSTNSDPVHLLSPWKPSAQSNLGCAACADSDLHKHRDIKALCRLLALLGFFFFFFSLKAFYWCFSFLYCADVPQEMAGDLGWRFVLAQCLFLYLYIAFSFVCFCLVVVVFFLS